MSDKGVLEILNTHLKDAIINHHCSTNTPLKYVCSSGPLALTRSQMTKINTPGKEIYKKLLFPLFLFSNIWTNLRTGVLFFDEEQIIQESAIIYTAKRNQEILKQVNYSPDW